MSDARGWSAAEIAGYDQELAAADGEIDQLARALKIGAGEVGERQALASMAALVSSRDTSDLAALVMVSVRRISGGQ